MYTHLSIWGNISYQTLKKETGHPSHEDEKMAWEKGKLCIISSWIDNKMAGSNPMLAACIYLSKYSVSDSMLINFFINHLFAFLTEFFESREQSDLTVSPACSHKSDQVNLDARLQGLHHI